MSPTRFRLPVVPACEDCNRSFSLDEQYTACAVEVAKCGTVEEAGIRRRSIRRILGKNCSLKERIRASQTTNEAGSLVWMVEIPRVQNVVMKVARGHVADELCPKLEEPAHVVFGPLPTSDFEQRSEFESVGTTGQVVGWPELGSRDFLRAVGKSPDGREKASGWIVVQPERYRYTVSEDSGFRVRMELIKYLACEVYWEP